MGKRRTVSLMRVAAALTMMTGIALGFGGAAGAHDMMAGGHPAHVHTGACATPGDVVFPLSDVGANFVMDGTPMAGTAMMGAESAIPVKAGVTTVQAALADIVAGDHAIVVHESADAIQNYIACGDVGGMMLGPSDLPIGLAPLSDSGYSGIAWLHDNGDGTTTIYTFLTQSGGMMGGMDHEMATPTP